MGDVNPPPRVIAPSRCSSRRRRILTLDALASHWGRMLAEETPLLLTKLEVPPPRTHTLARQRLLALAPAAPGTRLLLVSAPAGFGKTTFLSCWSRTLAA